MTDEHLLARFLGCIYLHIRSPELHDFAVRELVYLRTLIQHRPHLRGLASRLEEDLVSRIERFPADR